MPNEGFLSKCKVAMKNKQRPATSGSVHGFTQNAFVQSLVQMAFFLMPNMVEACHVRMA